MLGVVGWLCGFSIVKFIRYIKEELLIVLGTSSSESVLPRMLAKMENLGADKSVVGLVIPTGYSFNLDGTCIYLTMAAVFLAQATNTELSFAQQLGLIGILLLTSKGAAGVTGSGFIVLAATLASVGTVPVASIALILGVDRFMSEARALTNLVGNGVATVVVAKWEGRSTRPGCTSTSTRRRWPRPTTPRRCWSSDELEVEDAQARNQACGRRTSPWSLPPRRPRRRGRPHRDRADAEQPHDARRGRGRGRSSTQRTPATPSGQRRPGTSERLPASSSSAAGPAGSSWSPAWATSSASADKAQVTLIDRARTHLWKPLLHEVAAGSMDVDEHDLDYLAQAHWHHFRYRFGEMIGLDRAQKRCGSPRPTTRRAPDHARARVPLRHAGDRRRLLQQRLRHAGGKEHAIALESPDEAARFNRRLVNACLRAHTQAEPVRPGQLHVAIIGAGATGTELSAELHRTARSVVAYGLDRIDPDKDIKITLIEAADRILPGLPPRLSETTCAAARASASTCG